MQFISQILKTKYPNVRQYNEKDCGPAALLSILKFYNGNSSLPFLREICKTSLHGSIMLDIVNAAKHIGFNAYGASGEYEDLIKERMPAIAHLITDEMLNHFVVLYKIKPDKIFIADPGKGKYWLNKKDFLKVWQTKSVVILEPGKRLLKESTLSWQNWLLTYIKKEHVWVYQSLFLGTIYTILGLATAIFVQLLLDKFIPGKEYAKILYSGGFLIILLSTKALAGFLRQRFLIVLNQNVNTKINADFLEHLFKLPKKFFATRKIGEITARINDAVRIQRAVLQVIGISLIDCFVIIGSFGLMFYFSETLASLSLGLVPIYGLVLLLSVRKLKNEQSEVMKGYALVESNYFDSLKGIDEIISFNTGASYALKNKLFFGNYQEKVKSLGFTQANLSLFAEVFSSLIIAGLLVSGALWVSDGNLLIGEMMGAYSLLANILPAVNRFVEANIVLQETSIASTRLMDMLLIDKEKSEGKKIFEISESLSFRNGFFSWNGRKNLLENVNLCINKGRITSLWGNSGAGKSTIIQLIQRKYLLTGGAITVDHLNIDEIELSTYRSNIGVVPQSIKIFNGTIAENILVGRKKTDLNSLNNRIRELKLEKFYERFDYGLMTIIGEDGRELSGGEMQLISLTRALLEKPAVLIIDEGLSGIDVFLEKIIFDVIKNYSFENAVLLVTHNLNSIMKTDYVYILESGNIIEHGIPSQLANSTGHFSDIFKMKEELYKNNVEFLNE